MFTIKGCLSLDKSSLSFRTECILFLPMILVLCISFIAYIFWFFFNLTHQTLPNPPLPITYWQSKCYLLTYLSSRISFLSAYSLELNFDKSILKQFFISFVDFFDIVELLLLCYFYFLFAIYLLYLGSYLFWLRPDITTPIVLFTLIFLNYCKNTWSVGQRVAGSVWAFL